MFSTVDTVVDVGTGAADPVSSKGRPRAFDASIVLDALVQLFWEQGYEATSLRDIVEATGLSKSSLYNAFGPKDQLFAQALNRYVDCRVAMISEPLVHGNRGLEDLSLLLDVLWSEVEKEGDHRGCLAVNTSTELGQRDERVVDVGRRYRSSLRAALHAAFTRAGQLGEIEPAQTEHYTSVMVSFLLGTAVMVRSGADIDELHGQIGAARAMLEGWRIG